ncbi:MAG: RNA polymerase sigma factor [Planctomycetota bacterium]
MDETTTTTDGQGGRERIAQFMIENEAALRRRIGAEIRGNPGVDADDVFSTTLRRVDYAAARGSFRLRSTPEAWSFVARVLQRAVQRHRRRAARFAATVADVAHSAPQREEAPAPEERAELVSIMHELERTRPQDAEIIQHRLRGRRWREISQQMGVSEEALRQRWSSLMARLRERLAGPGPANAKAG